jgi:2-dehydropantoate 2-reductase
LLRREEVKKIAVLGAGAIGGVLGAYIARAGEDITLIDAWREHVEAMRQRGLRITGTRGEQVIKARALHIDELSQLGGKLDILFIAVKSYDTEKMLKRIKPYLKKNAWVVSCQNGINEDIIIPIVGRANTIPCVVTFGAELVKAGHINEPGKENIGFTVGELDGRITPRIKEIARLTGMCFKTKISTHIWVERWVKLSNNSVDNSLAAITGTKIRELIHNKKTRHVMMKIAIEIIQVAEALGYRLDKVAGISTELWKKSAQEWQPEIDKLLLERSVAYSPYTPSTLQDALRRRRLETEHLNGYIVKKGKEVGVPTPINKKLVTMATEFNCGRLKPGPKHLDTLYKLGQT